MLGKKIDAHMLDINGLNDSKGNFATMPRIVPCANYHDKISNIVLLTSVEGITHVLSVLRESIVDINSNTLKHIKQKNWLNKYEKDET